MKLTAFRLTDQYEVWFIGWKEPYLVAKVEREDQARVAFDVARRLLATLVANEFEAEFLGERVAREE